MKRILQKSLFCLLLTAGLGSAAKGDELIIAGGSADASIVIGSSATETEKYAAEELRRCIRIMSGVDLPIVTADAPVSGAQIIIGTPAGNSKINSAKDRLRLNGSNDEQTAVLREGNIIYLGGQTARAALYATYTFLEDVLGARWLWPGDSGEFIPKRSVVAVDDISIFEVPGIRNRGFTNIRSIDPETGTWLARNKMNMVAVAKNSDSSSTGIKELRKKGFQIRISGHFIVLPESILSAHPEYAALRNGSRSYSSANMAQLCWGNPGVQEEVATMIAGLWAASPFVDIIHFFPADNQSYCTDSLCHALAPDVSTRWQKFSQIVMEKVDETYPGKKYWTYAYQGYKDVPQTIASRFESIGYTLYEASYRHLLSSGYPGSAGAIGEINGWLAKGANLGIRGYEYIMFKNPMFVPLVSWEMDQMSWLADKGLTTYLSESRPYGSPASAAPENTYWMCNRMNLYAATKGTWNPGMTADSIVNDWCKTIYGPAAEDMAAYYRDIENAWKNAPGDIQEYSNPPASQVNNFLSPAAFVRLNGYFTQARTKLAGVNDADLRNRIAEQIDLESKMLANWQTIYNFKNNRAGRFETAIEKVDTLNDAAWNNVSKLPAFEDSTGQAVEEQTVVSKVWTATDLHLRITCQDNEIDSLAANASVDDDVAITVDDCMELYIQPRPDSPAYMHFAVNTLGKKYDAASAYGGTDFDTSWNPEWTAAVSVGADSWTVDITIPFSSLGITVADSVRFKMALKRSRAGRAENSGWPDASYFNPASFGLATLVSEIPDPAAHRVLLFDGGGTASGNVSTEFQRQGWEVARATGEEALREKLNEDAAVLLIKYGSATPFLSTDFYLNDIKNYIEKGRVVIISTARNIPVEEWFPGTPAVTWSGYGQHISASKSDYQLPGAWQTYPNNIRTAIRTKQTPVSAYMPQSEGWRVLLKMPLKNGTSQPFLLSRRIGDGLLVLTSSSMGYSGGYEMFGSRNIPVAVRLTENFKAEQEAFVPAKREQTITMDTLTEKVFGEPDFTITATSDSGLPVTLSSSDSTVASVTGSMVHLTGIGTAIITASQEGDETYEAAENVTRALSVVPDTQAPDAPALTGDKTNKHKFALNWQPSTDNIGVIGYHIYRNEIQLNTFLVTGTDYLAERPRGKDVYEFTVKALDAAGNLSPASNSVISANGKIKNQAADAGGNEGIVVYPNPSHGNFTVKINTNRNGEIAIFIFNTSGTVVQSFKDIKSGVYQKEFNVNHLPDGTYIVQVILNGFSQSKTIIIN